MKIQLRNDTIANWEAKNPILAVGEVGIEHPDRRKIGDGVTHWTSLPYEDEKLDNELNRLTSKINTEPDKVYTFRGKGLPLFPTTPMLGYYLTFYTLPTDNLILQFPDVDLPEGTIMSIDNNDKNDDLTYKPRLGDRIDGSLNKEVLLPPNSIAFLVKDGDGWITAYSGILADNLDKLIKMIKPLLPTGGAGLTIDEIQTQLKDRLHTFQEIQTEFSDQLHSLDDLEKLGFERMVYNYGLLDSQALPTNDDWATKSTGIPYMGFLPASNVGDKHIGVILPMTISQLVSNLLINDTEVEYSVKETVYEGASHIVFITVDTFDTNSDISINLKTVSEQEPVSGGSSLTLDDGENSIGGVKQITFKNGTITGDSDNVDFTSKVKVGMSTPPYTEIATSEIDVVFPLEVQPSGDTAQVMIKPGHFEEKVPASFYTGLNVETDVIGTIEGTSRKSTVWFDSVVKPNGTYIIVDDTDHSIGLQEDNNLDPNLTDGTAYLIYYRTAFKGVAPSNGFIQISLVDKITGDILRDDNGNFIAVRRDYTQGQQLKSLELTAIKKYKGVEDFQMIVEDSFISEVLTLENRTAGNSCIMIQALDTDDQTSRGLLQLEADTGIHLRWTSHNFGSKFEDASFFLKQDMPTRIIPKGEGLDGADGWSIYNWYQLKATVDSSGTLTVEDNVNDPLGFTFGKVLNTEDTQLLRGKSFNPYINVGTPKSGGVIYAAVWKGTPNGYTKEIISNLDPNGKPIMAAGWELLPTKIPCPKDTVQPNDTTGSFTVPVDAYNFAVLFAPDIDAFPNFYDINDFYFDKTPKFNGYYIYAPINNNERHLIDDTEYFECGINRMWYANIRYTINTADTPLGVGFFIKGGADIVTNWRTATPGKDFLTFLYGGKAKISTDLYLYPGEGLADGASTPVTLWWAKNVGGSWVKIDTSEATFTVTKGDKPKYVTMPAFEESVISGDQIKCFAKCDVDMGAYIFTDKNDVYIIQTTINFKEELPSSDTGGTGVDLSGFTLAPQIVEYGIYQFIEKSTIDIDIDIPADVEASVIAVEEQNLVTGVIRPMANVDYQYDPTTKKWSFNFGATKTGQVIIAFYA